MRKTIDMRCAKCQHNDESEFLDGRTLYRQLLSARSTLRVAKRKMEQYAVDHRGDPYDLAIEVQRAKQNVKDMTYKCRPILMNFG